MSTNAQPWTDRREDDSARPERIHPAAKLTFQNDVVVPLAQALAIGLATFVAVLVILLLFRVPWSAAWRWGLGFGIVLFGLSAGVFINEHREVFISPTRLAWAQFNAAHPQPKPEPADTEPWRVINPHNGPARPLLPDRVESQAAGILPPADPEVEMLYDFVSTVWPTGNISREHCRALGFTRSTWEKFVGGIRGREGLESGRGLLDRAHVVRKTSSGDWEICAPMGAALGWNRELREYAKAMKAFRDSPDRTGQDNPVPENSVPSGSERAGEDA